MNYSQFIEWFGPNQKKRYNKVEFGSDEWFVNRVFNLMCEGKHIEALVCLENLDRFRRQFVMREVLGAK